MKSFTEILGPLVLPLGVFGCVSRNAPSSQLRTAQPIGSATPCTISSTATYDVQEQSLGGNPLFGNLFIPTACSGSPQNVVIVLGGSEGGIPRSEAKTLATHGFTTLAVAYFDPQNSSLPPSINQIPLDFIDQAFSLGSMQANGGKCCGIFAGSKGSEAAFVYLAKTGHKVVGLVSVSGSNIAFEGLTIQSAPTGKSEWTYSGAQIPFLPYAPPTPVILQAMFPEGATKRPVLLPLYNESLKNTAALGDATAPVEKIAGPILNDLRQGRPTVAIKSICRRYNAAVS